MNDRDTSIERLLRRASAPNGEAASECLDAETLAAFADDTLPAAARRDAESHLADCSRCQALTAAMVRTEAASGATLAGPSRTRRVITWLVPAAAAAAAVGLWVLVPAQMNPPATTAVSDQQVAVAPPTYLEEPIVVEEQRRDAVESLRLRTAETAPAQPTPAQPTTALADKPSSAVDPARVAPATPEVRQEAAKTQDFDRPASADTDLQKSAEAPPAAATAPSVGAAPPAAPNVQESGGATGGRLGAAAAMRAAAFGVRAAFEIASPDPRIRWRVLPTGAIQRTVDQGATWTSQPIEVKSEVIAGSSPSPDVCWLVARGGIMLRTADAGRSWQQAALPGGADAVAITGTTGVDAVATLADGRRMATSDGGRTWVAAVP